MNIKTIQSPQYGKYYCREIARINYTRLADGWESWARDFSPNDYFGNVIIHTDENNYSILTYYLPLRRDNPAWPMANPECKYMQWAHQNKVRVKHMPIAETDSKLEKWLMETLPHMDKKWVEDNPWVLTFPQD